MRVQSETFRDPEYSSIVDRMEGVLELLVKQGNYIISVTITATKHPNDQYLGVIFYRGLK